MRRPNRPIPYKHRQNYEQIIKLHLSGKLGKKIPPKLMETVKHIRTEHPGTPEFYELKEMQEDRHPKGTGYGEEKKPKPKDMGPIRKATQKPKPKRIGTWE